MSPRLKEFITAVLLDLAENCDWTISPTGQIEHSPFFEYAEKHLHIIETELTDMREMFREYVKAEDKWRDAFGVIDVDLREQYRIEAAKLRKQAKEVLGL
jgi:hypothetical protein